MRFFRVVVVLARRFSFAYPSLNLRSTFAQGGLFLYRSYIVCIALGR